MKRILCLIDSLGSGGAQRQMAKVAILSRNDIAAKSGKKWKEDD